MPESVALCPRYIELKGKVTEAMAPDPSRKLHAGPGPSAPPLAGPPAKHANTPGKWPPDPCARMLRVSLRRGPGGTRGKADPSACEVAAPPLRSWRWFSERGGEGL